MDEPGDTAVAPLGSWVRKPRSGTVAWSATTLGVVRRQQRGTHDALEDTGLRPWLIGVLVFAVSATALVGCGGASGPTAGSGQLRVRAVTIDEPINGSNAVMRMVIENDTGVDDDLVAATASAGTATFHRSAIDSEGRSVMTALERVPVPDGRVTAFRPGGLHIMLEDLHGNLKLGQKVRAKLTFAKFGEVQVVATVVPIGSNVADSSGEMPGMADMPGMDHGDHR